MKYLVFLAVVCLSQPLLIPGAPSLPTEEETPTPVISPPPPVTSPTPPVTSTPDTFPPDTYLPAVLRDCGNCIFVGDDIPPGGCEDFETMACVCVGAEQRSCCSTKWASACVEIAMNTCNCVVPTPAVTLTPTVPPSPQPTSLPTAPEITYVPTPIPSASPTFGRDCGDCIAIHDESPPGGCTDPVTMECVCLNYLDGLFFSCCSYVWNDVCVLLAQTVCNCEPYAFLEQTAFFKVLYAVPFDTSTFDNDANSVWRLHCQSNDRYVDDLLYKASTHGFSSTTFHSKCDNKGPTLTIITTSDGAKFGGYTSISWTNTKNSYYTDPKAYLFGFEDGRLIKMSAIAGVVQNVYHRSDYGPAFGGGHDFYTYSNLNIVRCVPHSYERTDGGSYSSAITCGSSAAVTEVEVFRFGLCS